MAPIDSPNAEDYLTLLDQVLMMASGETIMIVDADTTICYVTSAVTETLGYLQDQLVGKLLSSITHPDEGLPKAAAASLAGGSGLHGSMRLRSTTGDWVRATVESHALDSTARGFVGLIIRPDGGTTHDVAIQRRLAIESYCNALGSKMLRATQPDDIGRIIQQSCAEIGQMVGSHSVSLYLERKERNTLQRVGHWFDESEGMSESPDTLELSAFPDWTEQILSKQQVVTDIHRNTFRDVQTLTKGSGLSAFLSVPFVTGEQRGLLALGRHERPHRWHLADAQLVRAASGVFSAALDRSRIGQFWRLTYDHGPVGFAVRSNDGYLIECNQQYLDLYGLRSDEDKDVNLFDRVHPEDLEGLQAILRVLDGPECSHIEHDFRVATSDGSHIMLHMRTADIEIPGQPDPLRLTAVQRIGTSSTS